MDTWKEEENMSLTHAGTGSDLGGLQEVNGESSRSSDPGAWTPAGLCEAALR